MENKGTYEYINHKPNMNVGFYTKQCFNCKYRISDGRGFSTDEIVGRCSYPFKGKCHKRSIGYRFGVYLAYFVLILGFIMLCILMSKVGNVFSIVWNNLKDFIRQLL